MTAKPNDGSGEQADQTSRREMLKRTAAATATMGVVGTAATGSASANPYGSRGWFGDDSDDSDDSDDTGDTGDTGSTADPFGSRDDNEHQEGGDPPEGEGGELFFGIY